MTGLYVICSNRPQKHLSGRRVGYREYIHGKVYTYAREAFAPDELGIWGDEQIKMLPQWIEDVRSVSDDPTSSFFCVWMKNRETVDQAIARGCALPLVRRAGSIVTPDKERRSARSI